jgi:uncharacterized protein involved in exopolysaccharide biosynthesis/Mrp family chromosome partitioning ATPase
LYTPYSPTTTAETVQEPYGSAIDIGDVLAYLRSSWRIIALCAAALGAAALIYAVVTPPTFTAKAQLMIDINKAQVFFRDSRQPERVPDQARIESQVEVLKSDRVALAVIRDLNLIEDPEFSISGEPLLEALLSRLTGDQPSALLRTLLSRLTGDESSADRAAKESYAADAFEARLSVRRVGQSLVIDVAFRSNDPTKAARIANAITDAYIKQDVQVKSEAAQRGGKWLSERLEELRQQSDDALRAYERFKLVGDKDSTGEPQVKLAELESVSQSYRRMYDVFLQQFTETMQKVSFPESDAHVVSIAAVPLAKSHPKSKLIVAFGVLLGAMIGTALSWARHSTDRSIRSPTRLVRAIGLDCLGAIRASPAAARGKPTVGRIMARLSRRQCAAKAGSLPLLRMASDHPSSAFTTDMRNLKNAVNNLLMGRKSRCIGVVAASRGEGATTIASNFSLLCSASGMRTLLVDACIDNPTISREFAPRDEVGLSQLLDDQGLFVQKMGEWAERRFSVLPIGKRDGPSTPGDRIGSERTALQIDDLGAKFDLVVFDLPALGTSPDALAIAPYLDGVLLIADFSTTSLDTMSAAVAALQQTRKSILGVVLNKVPPATQRTWQRRNRVGHSSKKG